MVGPLKERFENHLKEFEKEKKLNEKQEKGLEQIDTNIKYMKNLMAEEK